MKLSDRTSPTPSRPSPPSSGRRCFVIDCDRLRRQYHALAAALPGVDLHYALKPLPDPTVVQVLAREGAWFDLATNGEVDLVRDAGIPPAPLHPLAPDQARLRHPPCARLRREELRGRQRRRRSAKFDAYRKRVRLLLRISFRSPDTIIDLSRKFGCDADAAVGLVEFAAKRGIWRRGILVPCRLAGRETRQVRARRSTPAAAWSPRRVQRGCPARGARHRRRIPDRLPRARARRSTGFCAPIRAALARLPAGLRVIAEPGRFICGPAVIAISTVMGRAKREGRWWYYLDDGLYGTFSGQLYDKMRFPVEPLAAPDRPREPCVISGPTCDSIDVVAEDLPMPVSRSAPARAPDRRLIDGNRDRLQLLPARAKVTAAGCRAATAAAGTARGAAGALVLPARAVAQRGAYRRLVLPTRGRATRHGDGHARTWPNSPARCCATPKRRRLAMERKLYDLLHELSQAARLEPRYEISRLARRRRRAPRVREPAHPSTPRGRCARAATRPSSRGSLPAGRYWGSARCCRATACCCRTRSCRRERADGASARLPSPTWPRSATRARGHARRAHQLRDLRQPGSRAACARDPALSRRAGSATHRAALGL